MARPQDASTPDPLTKPLNTLTGAPVSVFSASGQSANAGRVPERWDAASPVAGARAVRTPVLLVYAGSGTLAGQGQAWHRALTAAGVPAKLIMVPGADHVFSSVPAQQRLHGAVTGWAERHR
jgi:acetyl esterase/lipase